MKKVLNIVLALVIVGMIYVIVNQVTTPIRFRREMERREAVVVAKLKDIRAAQQAYRRVFAQYTDNFDTLIHFVLNDSLVFYRMVGSADDSVAVARGEVFSEPFFIPVIDTAFNRRITREEVMQLPIIPFSNNERFLMGAGSVMTDAGVMVPVFEARAPYRSFLHDLNRQELINLIDERENTFGQYGGLKVGSLEKANNDAGNWE